jgi:hypothetical protein
VIPAKLHKVEKARGSEIGLDPRFEYFRFKRQPRFDNAALLKWFDSYESVSAYFTLLRRHEPLKEPLRSFLEPYRIFA